MKYLNELTKLKVFSYNDLIDIIKNSNLAKVTLQNYMKKGYIKRIKHNLYSIISLETNEIIASKFLIASKITETSFISHHSAFEFYGYYNQVYNMVDVSSISKFNNFSFEGNDYFLINTGLDCYVSEIRGVRVSSIERTIVDSIKDSGKYSDIEETLKCIQLIPYISIKDILNYLNLINSKILYKKVGVILSLFKNKFNIPDSFFNTCHNLSDSVVGYFDKSKLNEYNAEWKIYIYKGLENLIKKE